MLGAEDPFADGQQRGVVVAGGGRVAGSSRFGAGSPRSSTRGGGRYADQVAAALTEELQDVESPELLKAYLDDAVRRYATGPVDDLKRGLTAIGIDTATTAVSTKFEVPASVIAGLATPQLAAVGGVALALANLRGSTRQKAHTKQAAPAAYLLQRPRDSRPPDLAVANPHGDLRATGLRD